MSKRAYVWTDFDDDDVVSDWYQHSHIPSIVRNLGVTARHTEWVDDVHFRYISKMYGSYLTIYNLPDLPDDREDVFQDLQRQIRPAPDKLPKHAQVNTRIYTAFDTNIGEKWRGDERDVRTLIALRYQPHESIHDQFIKLCAEQLTPKMFEAPEVLRLTNYKAESGCTFKDNTYKDRDAKSFFPLMTTWELSCHEIPSQVLKLVNNTPEWLYYVDNDLVNWQISKYSVTNHYSDIESAPPVHLHHENMTALTQVEDC